MSLLGCIFLFSAGLRCLSSLFSPGAPESRRLSEDRLQLGLLLIGLLALGFIGLFPGITLPYLTEMASQLSAPFP